MLAMRCLGSSSGISSASGSGCGTTATGRLNWDPDVPSVAGSEGGVGARKGINPLDCADGVPEPLERPGWLGKSKSLLAQ